jgi:hypothetical protein
MIARAIFVFGLASASLHAQWIHQPTAGIPRTTDGKPHLTAPVPKASDGKPDLSGLWTLHRISGGITELKPTEIQPWAAALSKQREENLESDAPEIQCLPSGFIGGLVKFIQTPSLIVILSEDLTYRQIFLDGRDLPKDPNPAWMGYSVGHWDGDTLVVESTGYNDRTWLDMGHPHTENLRITERFHRRDFGHIDVDRTYSDPKIYAKSWSTKGEGLLTADTDLIEYVCGENEKDHTHLVGKSSDDTKNAIKLPLEVLGKFVGSYEFNAKALGIPGPETMIFKVELKDGVLQFGQGDTPKDPITPLSETTFAGGGAGLEFGKNDKGEITHLMIRVAEGEFRANRLPDPLKSK